MRNPISVLASPADIQRSGENKFDTFYELPREIECFIDRFNAENAGKARAKPWTILQQVSIFVGEELVGVVTYEMIEDHIVFALALGAEMATKFLKVPPKSVTDEQWTMKNGQKIAVADMSEQHAKNALRLVLRRWREAKAAKHEQAFSDLLDQLMKPD